MTLPWARRTRASVRTAGADRSGRGLAEREQPAETRTTTDTPSLGRGENLARSVPVWDLPTRLFHWLLVAAVAVGLATGFLAPEAWLGVHMTAGYVVLGLLSFRVIWGFFGSEYSRLASFVYPARRVIEHLRGLVLLRPPHYLGHNPSGAVMIFALFAVLAGLVVTGLIELAGEEKQGPLAGVVGYALGNGAKPVHWILASFLLAMIALHLAGVLVGTWLLKEPLIRAMITGRKPVPANAPLPRPRPARPVKAALWLALTAVSAAAGIGLLSRLPPVGIPVLPANEAMLTECGDCHHPFHPSLLPRASWARLMALSGRSLRRGCQPARRQARRDRRLSGALRRRSLGHRGRPPVRRGLPSRSVADYGNALLAPEARQDRSSCVRRQARDGAKQLHRLP